MKKILITAVLIMLVGLRTYGQSTTSFTVTVVAPPTCTVTLSSNPVSISGSQLYAGQAGTINFNVSACTSALVSTATATWDGAALTVKAPFAVSVTAAQATAGPHTLVLTIPQPMLAMNSPVQLPNASLGQPYTADLASITQLQKSGQPCSTCTWSASTLPSGLTLSPSGVVSGTPSGVGSLTYTVTDTAPTIATNIPTGSWKWAYVTKTPRYHFQHLSN